MNVAWKATAALLVAVLFASCSGGGGGGGEEGAIKDLMEQFFAAFENGDSAQLAALFSSECGDLSSLTDGAIASFQDAGDNVDVQLSGIDVQNLTATSAEVLPEGTIVIDGEEAALSDEGEAHTALVKENGVWKIAQCDLFL